MSDSSIGAHALDAAVDAITKGTMGLTPVSKAINLFSQITPYTTGNEKWYDNLVNWISNNVVDDVEKDDKGNPKKLFDGNLAAARAFLENLKNNKRMQQQLKWRVPSVYQRIAAAEQNKTINPMLIRGLTNSSSNQYNKLFA
jgi:hypothetical protein